MPNIFWNAEQKRMRAFWRICLQVVLTFLFTTILSFALVTLIRQTSGAALSGSSMAPAELQETMMDIITDNPVFFFLSEFLSFLPVVLSVYLAGLWFDKRKLMGFGLHIQWSWWRDFFFGLGLGAFLMTFIFLVEWAAGWIQINATLVSIHQPFYIAICLGLCTFIFVGISEELLSRGYQFVNLAEGLNLPWLSPRLAIFLAYILSSSIFGLLHLGNPDTSLVSTINLILAGLFLGIGMLLTGELAIGIGLHITWNFFQGMVFGFPVSGLEPGVTFIAVRQGGPEIWTGGAFGPEAGVIGLMAMALGTALTLLWIKRQYGRIRLFKFVGNEPTPDTGPQVF